MSDISNNSNTPSPKKERVRGKAKNTVIDNPERYELMRSQFDNDINEREFDSYGPNSNKKVWWKCLLGHSWEASFSNLYKSNAGTNGCPYCVGRKVCDTNCLSFTHNHLALEWHPIKNELSPNNITAGSNNKVWWKCSKNSEHEWEATINSRSKGTGCPHCNGKTTADGNTLADKYPDLILEWHPTANDKLTPFNVTPGSDKKVWWICPKMKHEYQAKIGNRTKNETGCPFCAGKKVCEDNSFAKCYPKIAKEWHPKNENGPDMYSRCSGQYAWWKCSKNHEWLAQISNRVKGEGTGCPYCSGRLASEERNLAQTHPHRPKICKALNL